MARVTYAQINGMRCLLVNDEMRRIRFLNQLMIFWDACYLRELYTTIWTQVHGTRFPPGSYPCSKQQDTSTALFISLFTLLIMFHYFIKENISDSLVSRLVYGLQACVSWEKKCLEENQTFVD